MTELLSSRIAGWGIDVFRNDRNACPLPVWRAADAADRKGITEIRSIEGLYAMWDAMLERHPGLMIDNGNWRVTGPDIEVMRRSVGCLTRSETAGPSLSHPAYDQMQTASLSMWVPLHSTLLHGVDPYTFRSAATMGVAIGLDLRSKYIPIETVKHGIEELKSLRPYWLGDYYPLTPVDNDESHWCGWQFHRPDLAGGFAVLFRRPKSRESGLEVRLRGLRPKAKYEVTFAETYDVKDRSVMLGRELSRLPVTIASTPGSLLIRYRRIP
jgi:alpha-galactosidase